MTPHKPPARTRNGPGSFMPFRAFDLAEVAATLRESEQRYKALFERAPAPIIVIDANTLDILGVNDAAISRYGYTREEFLTHSLRDLWPPFERGSLFHAEAALKAGHDLRAVFRHWSKERDLFDVELSTRALSFGDNRLRVVFAFDVTEHTRSIDITSFLDRASGLFAASLNTAAICRNLASVAAARLGDWCAVHRIHPEASIELAGFAHANPLDELLLESAVRARQPLAPDHPVKEVIDSGRSRVLAAGDHSFEVMRGARDTTAATGDADRRLTVRAAMYVPIHARGRVLAVLECVAATDHLAGEANNVALGEELASRAALALDAAMRYEALARATPISAAPLAARRSPPTDTGEFGAAGTSAEAILESITDGFIAVDADWHVTYVNRMAERMLQQSRDQIVGRSFWETFPDVRGSRFEMEYRRTAATREVVEFEEYHAARDAWYRVGVHPAPRGLGIFFRETTSTHRVEDERRDANRVLYEYAERATDLIHLVAPDGRVVYANRAWRDTLGYGEGEVESVRLQDIVAPEFRQVALDSMARRLAGDSAHVVELDVLAKDGRRVRVQGTGTCRFVQGQPMAVLGIFRDVTAQRESEAALEAARLAKVIANRTKTEFLDRMNHELRTPLTGIIGFARLLQRNRSGAMSATEVDFASRIARQGRELLAVIEDVLSYAEIEGRRLELEEASVDLRALISEVATEFAQRAADAGSSVVVEMPADDVRLNTDASRLRQILKHLVDNAVKFSSGKSVSITLSTDAEGRPRRIEVCDRGIGIPAGQEADVLEPFRQGDQDNARLFGGVGLGLSIARALARLLGFELSLRSRPGEGTRAVLSFESASEQLPRRTSGEHEPPERESAELAALLQGVVRASPLAVIAFDTQYQILLWNDAAERIFGWSAAEAIGMRMPTVPESELESFRELMRRVVETGGVTEEPVKRHRKDGTFLDAHASVAPLRDAEGRLMGFMCLVADVTEQNRREAQLRQAQKMEVIGKLAGGIAHDFNNLLTVIGANATFLMQDLESADPRRRDAEAIRAAGTRAAALTRQLLLFARKQAPERRVVDLRDTVADTQRMFERLIGSNIELANLRALDECRVLADPGQLEQLVMNLVLNARDAMENGGALVIETQRRLVAPTGERAEIDVRGHDITPGEYAVLIVSDTGHGMEPTTVQRIFEPFYTTKASGSGTGLGLATVDAIVADAGGFVQVESAAGAGTTFRVFLPIAPADAVDDHVRSQAVTSGGSETVLLVEDEEAVRTIATRILSSQGYSVLSARHGKDALELAANHDGPIDLLLTDLVMPEMDGYTLAARLRELRPQMRIVFISGYTEPSARAAGSHAAPDGLIVHKPFSSDDLAAITRRALDTAS